MEGEEARGGINVATDKENSTSTMIADSRDHVAKGSNYLDVMVLEVHGQFLHCQLNMRGIQDPIFISFVSGANNGIKRKKLWSGLRKFKVVLGSKPWVVLGDFNVMLFPHDRYGGSSRRNVDMSEFYTCVEDVELFDLHYTGIHFTWNQKPNEEGGIRRKLDRVLANTEFTPMFHDANVHFLPCGLSDHSPAVLTFKGGTRKKIWGFKFDNFLVEHPLFLQIVKNEWSKQVEGSFMFRMTSHLKALKTPLRKLRNSYDTIQVAVDNDPSNEDLSFELGHLRLAYQKACWDEECAVKQRAKVKWLNEGDSNTKFFHGVIKEGRHVNYIQLVCTSHGNYVYEEDVPMVFVEYFKGFLGLRDDLVDLNMPDDLFSRKLSLSDVNHTIHPISNEEIRSAMFSIGNNKAPGSDGYFARFFKASWDIIGRDVEVAIHNFFYRGNLAK
ncbi:uncharacterized protein LOC112514134 [Cynara cardunculus var. scolymus]|uniref:uncharacterized protein LOC112514134 n=1 Tax=Cynara cardunculus var. scolymus TaxID=59895 RepID=UPI000D6302B2|nr:uncharacterized protein LOC112514134 [Cynara cardunculus var. scolymus]